MKQPLIPAFGILFSLKSRDLKSEIIKLVVTYFPQNIQGPGRTVAVGVPSISGKDSLEISFLSSLPENFWTVVRTQFCD